MPPFSDFGALKMTAKLICYWFVIVGCLEETSNMESILCPLSGIGSHTRLTASIRDARSKATLIGLAILNEEIEILFSPINFQVGWMVGGHQVQYRCHKDFKKFQVRFPFPRTASCTAIGGLKIRILKVAVEDSGNYTCTIWTNKKNVTATAALKVLQTPAVEKIVLRYNKTITLTCPSYLKAIHPHVEWKRGKASQGCKRNCFNFTINEADFSDSGEYFCSRITETGKAVLVKIFNIVVTGKPGPVNVTVTGDRVKLEVDNRNSPVTKFLFTCSNQTISRTAKITNASCRNGICYVQISNITKQLGKEFVPSNCKRFEVSCIVQARNDNGLGQIPASSFNLWNSNNCTDLKNLTTQSNTRTVIIPAASVVGGLVFVVFVAFFIFRCWRSKRDKKTGKGTTAANRQSDQPKRVPQQKTDDDVGEEAMKFREGSFADRQRNGLIVEFMDGREDNADASSLQRHTSRKRQTDTEASSVQASSEPGGRHDKFPSDSDEVTNDDLKYFAHAGASKWKDIGYKLLPFDTITSIIDQSALSTNWVKLFKVLIDWKTRSESPTIGKLVKAFGHAGISKNCLEKTRKELL